MIEDRYIAIDMLLIGIKTLEGQRNVENRSFCSTHFGNGQVVVGFLLFSVEMGAGVLYLYGPQVV